jgi:hypothetical protein
LSGFALKRLTFLPAPVIVRTKSQRASVFGDAPDMTPEEHHQRGDAVQALWHELARRAAGDG